MDSVFVDAIFKSWIFRLRAKVDTFNVSGTSLCGRVIFLPFLV